MGLIYKGTPVAIVNKLNQQVQQIMALPEVRQMMMNIGFEPWTGSPQDLERIIATEYAKWGEVVKTAGMTAQ